MEIEFYETSLKILYKITQALFNIILKKKTMANSPKLHQIEKKIVTKRPGLSIHSVIYTWATLQEYGHTTYVYSITPRPV